MPPSASLTNTGKGVWLSIVPSSAISIPGIIGGFTSSPDGSLRSPSIGIAPIGLPSGSN